MNKVRIGIIGIGNIGFTHACRIYENNIQGLSLAAVCDCDPQRKEPAAQKLSGVPFYEDYHRMLAQAELDAVLIAVPHPMHAQIAMDAFACQKHVLVEKPVDICVSMAQKLNDAARKSGKQFAIMFNQRTGQLFKKAKQLVQSGQLGQLKRSTWIVTNWYRTQHYYDSGDWRATWAGEGGGVLMNQAPHQLDLWQWICGMPESVTAVCDTGRYHNIEVEDSATIYARFPHGATGLFITSTGEFPGTNRLELTGTLGKIVLEEGKLRWWRLCQDEREFCATDTGESCKIPYEYTEICQEGQISGHQLILQNFTDAILHNEPLIAPGYDGILGLSIQNAAYLSAWKGNIPVQLPLDTQEYDALLAQHRQASGYIPSSCHAVPRTDYSERWQINW